MTRLQRAVHAAAAAGVEVAWRVVSARTPEEAACRAVEEVEGDICDFQVGSGLASRRVRVKVGGARGYRRLLNIRQYPEVRRAA